MGTTLFIKLRNHLSHYLITVWRSFRSFLSVIIFLLFTAAFYLCQIAPFSENLDDLTYNMQCMKLEAWRHKFSARFWATFNRNYGECLAQNGVNLRIFSEIYIPLCNLNLRVTALTPIIIFIQRLKVKYAIITSRIKCLGCYFFVNFQVLIAIYPLTKTPWKGTFQHYLWN